MPSGLRREPSPDRGFFLNFPTPLDFKCYDLASIWNISGSVAAVYVHSAYLCVHTNPEYESMKLYKCDSTKDDSTKDDSTKDDVFSGTLVRCRKHSADYDKLLQKEIGGQ